MTDKLSVIADICDRIEDIDIDLREIQNVARWIVDKRTRISFDVEVTDLDYINPDENPFEDEIEEIQHRIAKALHNPFMESYNSQKPKNDTARYVQTISGNTGLRMLEMVKNTLMKRRNYYIKKLTKYGIEL